MYCLADIASDDWNQVINSPVACRRGNLNIEIRMNPVVRPGTPPTRAKHLVWALYALPQWWQSKNYIGESFFVIVLGDTRLAVCKILMTPSFCPSESGVTELIESGAVRQSLVDPEAVFTRQAPSCPPKRSSPANNIASIDDQPLGTQTADLGMAVPCDIRITWIKPRVRVCTAFQFYIAMMNAIVVVAELEYHGSSHGLPLYFPDGDFSLQLDATSLAAREEGRLKNFMVIGALETLADLMESVPAEFQFNAFEGSFKWDGPYVGKIWFRKGREPISAGPENEVASY